LETGYIHINNYIFPTLFAISSEEQQRGLMYQEWPPPIMSFVYANPQINRFWMKSTPSPLDIVFCHKGKITEICYGEPNTTNIIGSGISDLVIEFPYGTINEAQIKHGHSVDLVKPSWDELRKIIAQKYYNLIKI